MSKPILNINYPIYLNDDGFPFYYPQQADFDISYDYRAIYPIKQRDVNAKWDVKEKFVKSPDKSCRWIINGDIIHIS